MNPDSGKIVEGIFRSEYGKLIAILTRCFGTTHIQLAEDVVQETLIAALNNWSTSGIPDNPSGWLVRVARRKALNEINRNKIIQQYLTSGYLDQNHSDVIESVFLDTEIKDNQLRMIFTCCHDELDMKSQIALTLKTLCGFGVNEVANAMLTSPSTINKRLYRAKEKIRKSKSPFKIPQGKDLERRINAVLLTLYLIFNEGYNSTSGDKIIQKELCLDAFRLTQLMVDHFEQNGQAKALLALMCFHTARFDARIDNKGAIILFADQDRSLWNKSLINIGMHHFERAMTNNKLSSYHVEAGIAAEHCLAKDFSKTNWQFIYDQYVLLSRLKPNPVIRLNLAIIKSKLSGIEDSLNALKKLESNKDLSTYHLLPATQGIFHMQQHQFSTARTYLTKALALATASSDIAFIENKLIICEKTPDN